MGRSLVARWARSLGLLGLLVVLGLSPARAQITPAGPALEVLGNGWRVLQPTSLSAIAAPSRTIVGTAAGAVVTDGLTIAGRGGPLAVNAVRTAGWDIVGGAIARCLAGGPVAMAVCAGGTAAAFAVYDKYRVRPAATSTGLGFDPGTDQVDQSVWAIASSSCSGNPTAADIASSSVLGVADTCLGIKVAALNRGIDPKYAYSAGSCTANEISGAFSCTYWPSGAANPSYLSSGANKTTSKTCPAVVDFSDPFYSAPVSVVGPDGKCPTGRYSSPVTAEQAGAKLAPVSADYPQLVQALKDALSQGQTVGAPGSTPITTSGPASQTGTPTTTTTTAPDGTTTTQTQTPVYNYTYGGDTITYNTSVTNITNNNGQVTTTTTSNPKEDGLTDCDKYPDSLGCLKLGEAPTDQVPKGNRSITFTSEDVGSGGGQCPAPVPLPHGQFISYQTTCDGLAQARPLIIAMGFVMAGLIMVGGMKV